MAAVKVTWPPTTSAALAGNVLVVTTGPTDVPYAAISE